MHRAEQSHPGDSDYDDSKQTIDDNNDDNDSADKPECPFGKACYRQNPQHKLDFKH
jgi:aprataxin and PNK-like factor